MFNLSMFSRDRGPAVLLKLQQDNDRLCKSLATAEKEQMELETKLEQIQVRVHFLLQVRYRSGFTSCYRSDTGQGSLPVTGQIQVRVHFLLQIRYRLGFTSCYRSDTGQGSLPVTCHSSLPVTGQIQVRVHFLLHAIVHFLLQVRYRLGFTSCYRSDTGHGSLPVTCHGSLPVTGQIQVRVHFLLHDRYRSGFTSCYMSGFTSCYRSDTGQGSLPVLCYYSKTCLQGTPHWGDSLLLEDVFSERCHIFSKLMNLRWRVTCDEGSPAMKGHLRWRVTCDEGSPVMGPVM